MKKLRLFALAGCALAVFASAACRVKTPKVTPDTVQVAVAARGYGTEWAEAMCRAFTRKTEIPSQVVYTTPDINFDFVDSNIRLGPSKNTYDVMISMNNDVFNHLSQKGTVVSGYDSVWADLTDVYESPMDTAFAEAGANVKIKDIIHPFYYNMATYSDAKQYLVPYVSGMTGFLYNKGAFDSANKNLSEGSKLKLPRTTGEMFSLFNDINGLRASGGTEAYPLAYSGADDYSYMLYQPLWVQYDGLSAVRELLEGKYNGDYSQGWKGF